MPSIIRTLYNMKSLTAIYNSSRFWNHNIIKFKSRKSKIQIALNGYETYREYASELFDDK